MSSELTFKAVVFFVKGEVVSFSICSTRAGTLVTCTRHNRILTLAERNTQTSSL